MYKNVQKIFFLALFILPQRRLAVQIFQTYTSRPIYWENDDSLVDFTAAVEVDACLYT